jgi:hypothetical protein
MLIVPDRHCVRSWGTEMHYMHIMIVIIITNCICKSMSDILLVRLARGHSDFRWSKGMVHAEQSFPDIRLNVSASAHAYEP